VDSNDIISSGLLELHAAGLASAEESKQVCQWALEYGIVADELKKIEGSIDLYILANATLPGTEIKEKIFNRINNADSAKVIPIKIKIGEKPETKFNIGVSFWKSFAAACAVLLVSSVVYNIVLVNKYNASALLFANTQTSLIAIKQQSAEITAEMQVVKSKYSVPVSLNGLEAAPDAAAKIFWMKNTGEVFIDPSNLPTAPRGKRYQVWAFVDGKPIDAGFILISKNGDKYGIQKMKTFVRVEAFAVSLEEIKDTPSVNPLGPVFVMGKI